MVPAASARMLCDMQCRLTTAHREIDHGRLEPVATLIREIENILHRAIECGAVVDPWNILGFGGQFGLFPSPENSIHDYRIDELLNLMSDIFALYIRTGKEAAALGNDALQAALAGQLRRLTEWWDKFATTEVSEIGGISGHDTYESAQQVASALKAWHEAGAAAGDIAFWRDHVENFRTAKSYALVVDTLLDHGDLVAAQALLVHWLSQADLIPLAEESYSFNELAVLWMEDLWSADQQVGETPGSNRLLPGQRWTYAKKFLDYLEANAGEFWRVPHLEAFAEGPAAGKNGEEEQHAEDGENLYSAAYEHLTYRDSTDDGIDGSLFEAGADAEESELVFEAERIVGRLAFLAMIAHLWKMTATVSLSDAGAYPQRDEVLAGWCDQAAVNYRGLLELLSAVGRYRIPAPSSAHESMVEYDRRRSVKEMLLESIINTCVDTADAARMIRAAMTAAPPAADDDRLWEEPMHRVVSAVLRGQASGARKEWKDFLTALREQPLLYVSLARGGSALKIVCRAACKACCAGCWPICPAWE